MEILFVPISLYPK